MAESDVGYRLSVIGKYDIISSFTRQDIFVKHFKKIFIIISCFWCIATLAQWNNPHIQKPAQAVLHGAGVIKLFLDEAEKEKQIKALYEKNRPWLNKQIDKFKNVTDFFLICSKISFRFASIYSPVHIG